MSAKSGCRPPVRYGRTDACRLAWSAALLLVIAGGVAACADPLAPERDATAPVQTSATSYVLTKAWVGWKTDIPFVWRNAASDTLYIVNCGGATFLDLQKQEGSGWKTFWGPVIPLCLGPPIVIPPGGTYADTVHVWGAEPGHNALPEFPSSKVEGVFRLVWTEVVYHYTAYGSNFGDAVPEQYRYSNSFRLSQD